MHVILNACFHLWIFFFLFKHFTNHLVWIEIDIHNIKGIFLEVKFLNDHIWYRCECTKHETFIDPSVRFDKITNVSKTYPCLLLRREKVKCWCQCFSVMIRDRLNALKTALGINELVWHTSWYQFQYKISVLLLKHY